MNHVKNKTQEIVRKADEAVELVTSLDDTGLAEYR